MKWKKWLYGLVPLLILLLLFFNWQTRTGEEYAFAKVRYDSIELNWKEKGYLVAQEDTVLYGPVTTKVLEVYKKSGDKVQAGELLLRLDGRPLQERLAQIEAQIEGIQQEMNREGAYWQVTIEQEEIGQRQLRLTEIEADRERIYQLVEAGAKAPVELEKIEQEWEMEQSRLTQAQARLTQAEVLRDQGDWSRRLRALEEEKQGLYRDLSTLEVRAPFAGTILGMEVHPGKMIDPSRPLLQLIGQGLFEVEVPVFHEEINKVQKGQEVLLSHRGTDLAISGIVKNIGTRAEAKLSPLGLEQRRVPVYIELQEKPESWLEGFPIDVTFSWISEESLLIPRTSLLSTVEGTYVYALQDGVIERREIRLGVLGEEVVQVLEGLEENEEILLFPSTI
ncbi:efflux RND transporter periplasmic adaptor subunit [Heliorestis convoluta]|uniref:Efflux transporter, RND family, MFP subunit n=1 Tax=Heliorestis convoluta TaxID=356322 RepID=A0A5Q2MYW2_9FIRM|nr:HlyD family efflux transporter periplasmic adaptor subunit [Heliorestis convoluta]QGG46623.1 efflux transporter, RND family, MFP subunit [Heliorestis convoluta]